MQTTFYKLHKPGKNDNDSERGKNQDKYNVAENDWFLSVWWPQFINIGSLSVAASAYEIGAIPAVCLIMASWILFCNYHSVVWHVWSSFPPSPKDTHAQSKESIGNSGTQIMYRPQNMTDLISAVFGSNSVRARIHRLYVTLMAVVSAWFSLTFVVSLYLDIFRPDLGSTDSSSMVCRHKREISIMAQMSF